MKDILETLQALQDTPVPNLLVIAGIIFLLPAFVARFGAFVELPPSRQRWASIIGIVLLILGIGFFIVPSSSTPATPPVTALVTSLPPTNTPTLTSMSPSPTETPTREPTIQSPQYIVTIYYFPRREDDANRIAEILEERGYIVNKSPATPALKDSELRTSYIYFKKDDIEEMDRLQKLLSDNLNEEFNVYYSSEDRPDKTMRVVLTHAIY